MFQAEYIPFCIHQYLWPYKNNKERLTWNWAIFIFFHAQFTQVFHTISILLTLTLAVWRYIAIAYPQHNIRLCSMTRAIIAILIDFIVSIIFNIPGFLNIAIKEISHEGEQFYIVGFSVLADSTDLKTFNFWIYSVVLKLLPCVALSVLSAMLIKELLIAGQRRAAIMSKRDNGRSAEAERQAERVTRMLLAILILFLVSEVPQGILGLLSGIPQAGFFKCYRNLGDVMDMLTLFNSAINFILYCVMSQQFRTTFKDLCSQCTDRLGGSRCRNCCKKENPSLEGTTLASSSNTCKTFV